jgi:hypothetical protein
MNTIAIPCRLARVGRRASSAGGETATLRLGCSDGRLDVRVGCPMPASRHPGRIVHSGDRPNLIEPRAFMEVAPPAP